MNDTPEFFEGVFIWKGGRPSPPPNLGGHKSADVKARRQCDAVMTTILIIGVVALKSRRDRRRASFFVLSRTERTIPLRALTSLSARVQRRRDELRVCERARSQRFDMQKMRCRAITRDGDACKMLVVRDGLCRCHHPRYAPAFHQRNRQATKRYWEAWRLARALERLASARSCVSQ